MKLYEYEMGFSGGFKCIEHEDFEENEKTFCKKTGCCKRVKKIDIGITYTCFNYPKLWLIEKDDIKAKSMFKEYYRDKINVAKQKCEEACKKYETYIAELN